ncbi:hypothetical protein IV102_01420 [bacterium]|nr:hypothetical protein [bacterium]
MDLLDEGQLLLDDGDAGLFFQGGGELDDGVAEFGKAGSSAQQAELQLKHDEVEAFGFFAFGC